MFADTAFLLGGAEIRCSDSEWTLMIILTGASITKTELSDDNNVYQFHIWS